VSDRKRKYSTKKRFSKRITKHARNRNVVIFKVHYFYSLSIISIIYDEIIERRNINDRTYMKNSNRERILKTNILFSERKEKKKKKKN